MTWQGSGMTGKKPFGLLMSVHFSVVSFSVLSIVSTFSFPVDIYEPNYWTQATSKCSTLNFSKQVCIKSKGAIPVDVSDSSSP